MKEYNNIHSYLINLKYFYFVIYKNKNFVNEDFLLYLMLLWDFTITCYNSSNAFKKDLKFI